MAADALNGHPVLIFPARKNRYFHRSSLDPPAGQLLGKTRGSCFYPGQIIGCLAEQADREIQGLPDTIFPSSSFQSPVSLFKTGMKHPIMGLIVIVTCDTLVHMEHESNELLDFL